MSDVITMSIDVDGQMYEMHQLTGKVMEVVTRSKMEITGGGGGGRGYTSNGSGSTNIRPIHISSTTTEHQEIYVRGESGDEERFSFTDNLIPTRKGHILTFVWAVKQGDKNGPIVHIYNHSTEESHLDIVGELVKPGCLPVFVGTLGLPVAGYFLGGLYGDLLLKISGAFAGFMCGSVVLAFSQTSRAGAFTNSQIWRDFIEDIEALDRRPFEEIELD